MAPGRATGQRGFTLLEVIVASAVAALALSAILSLLNTADGLAAESRVRLRAVAENRTGLVAIATALRGIDLNTLQGFDADGVATNPVYRTVVGSDGSGVLHGETEELRWMPSSETVPGVGGAGAVHLLQQGSTHRLANRVVAGGFRLSQLGSTLVVRLRTYYTTREGRTIVVDGRTAASSRN